MDGSPPDAFVQFGGQTPLGLAPALNAAGIELRGLDLDAIDATEERMRFAGLVERLGIPQPQGGMAASVEEAFVVAERVGYPVIVRPSFVIGGLAIGFAYAPDDLARIVARAVAVDEERPVRIDAYLEGLELDVDAVTDGRMSSSPASSSTSSGRGCTAVTRSACTRRSTSRRLTSNWWSMRSRASRARSASAG